MTEMLYQKDSYMKEFDCRIVDVITEENAVILDRTVFYPGGGGQPCDIGILESRTKTHLVKKVKNVKGTVYHYIEGKLPQIDETLKGQIDWEKRYQLMRTHTALHILCGVVWRDYHAQVTGGNMEYLKGRMDFEFENLTQDLIKEIEEKVNIEVDNKRNIKVDILDREEAEKIPDLIRTKINLLPKGIKKIRTIDIEGLDLQADGGTHVNNTFEVGRIKVTDYKSKGKINKRIYIDLID